MLFCLPFYFDDDVGAHHGAGGAADTFVWSCAFSGMMAFFVNRFCGQSQDAFGACVDTKSAALAFICPESEFCHFIFPLFYQEV